MKRKPSNNSNSSKKSRGEAMQQQVLSAAQQAQLAAQQAALLAAQAAQAAQDAQIAAQRARVDSQRIVNLSGRGATLAHRAAPRRTTELVLERSLTRLPLDAIRNINELLYGPERR